MGDFRRASPFFTWIVRLSRPILLGPLRLKSYGLENVPKDGGFVVASNHVSMLDPWPIGYPLYPRQIHYMAKAELYKNPVLKWILTKGETFPVRRGERDSEAFKTAVRYAKEGGVVAMFPEGTRRVKGLRKKHTAKPHVGAARIAMAAGVPLVPAAIAGTDNLRKFEPIRIAYGPPIQIETDGGKRKKEAAEDATKRLMEEIARLESTLALPVTGDDGSAPT